MPSIAGRSRGQAGAAPPRPPTAHCNWLIFTPNTSCCAVQVTNGKGGMPAWGDRLDEDEIVAVANYV